MRYRPARLAAPVILALAVQAALGPSAAAQQPASAPAAESRPAYRDASLDFATRAKDLVARMTLEEKARQAGHTAPAIPRLGVPAYNWWNEGLHGVARAGVATVFPQAIGMAATWDAELMHETAQIISTEFRAKYLETLQPDGSSGFYQGLTVWSPNINIFRDPRWGRGQETYGEDPYLTVADRHAPSSPACRATIPGITRPSPRPSISPCTAGRSKGATSRISTRRRRISRNLFCRPSVPP